MTAPTGRMATPDAATSRPTERNPRRVAREIAIVLEAAGHRIAPQRLRVLADAYCGDAATVNISIASWVQKRGDVIEVRQKQFVPWRAVQC